MDRKYREASDFSIRFRRRMNGAGAALATTDGRWAVVSTGMTVLVAGAVTLMAMGTMPASNPMVGTPSHIPLSYELFRLLRNGGLETAAPEAPPETDNQNANPGVETRSVTLDPGDTLAGILEDSGISDGDANAAILALRKQYDPRGLKAGQSFDITYSVANTIDATGTPAQAKPKTTTITVNHRKVVVPVNADAQIAEGTNGNVQAISRLLSLHFSPAIEQDVTVTRAPDGSFAAQTSQKVLQVHRHRAGATIDSSLYLSAMQAGIPADVVVDMIRMFSYKVDFQRDLHPGDSFEVYYDYYYTPDGQPAKDGSISYARMRLSGNDIVLYRYQPDPNDPPDYFDAKGQSARGMLMKTPVDGARISSGFGSRFHPILGYTRMHKGVDFAVPMGTPVMAAGAGTVQLEGRYGGYGNFMKVNHGNGYATGYAHLSRFAPGLHIGSRVRQGQVIAYSGMTGMATGPHLHYEIFVNGTQVNPLKVKMAQGRVLTGRDLRAFQEQRLKVDQTVASMPLEIKVADISTDLRQAKAK
ncbi:MAG TPA: M23 family metallopeptidase [Rhizomicrobium sp.]|nr:M23 family metallopeptidase [Rhizomicrobium sp.]